MLFLSFQSPVEDMVLSVSVLHTVWPAPPAHCPHSHLLSFPLMNERWRAARDVLVIVDSGRCCCGNSGKRMVTSERLKIHGIYSTTSSAWAQWLPSSIRRPSLFFDALVLQCCTGAAWNVRLTLWACGEQHHNVHEGKPVSRANMFMGFIWCCSYAQSCRDCLLYRFCKTYLTDKVFTLNVLDSNWLVVLLWRGIWGMKFWI